MSTGSRNQAASTADALGVVRTAASGTIGHVQRPGAVRGTLRLHVEELDLESVARAQMSVSRAQLREYLARAAVTLSSVQERLGGSHGEIVDQFGDPHSLSVAEWSHREPETSLTIYFTFQQDNAPEGFRGSTYPLDVLSFVRATDDPS